MYRTLILCFLLLWTSGCLENKESRYRRWDQKGETHYVERKYESAIKEWQRVLSIQPNAIDIYYKIGKTYLRLAEFSKADETFNKIIQLKPDAWDAWLEIGRLRLLSGDLETAGKIWTKLSSNCNKDPAIHVFYGDLMVLKYQLNKAALAYQQALAIEPCLDIALIKLASCQVSQNEIELADKTYQIVASLGSHSSEAWLQMSHFWRLRDKLEKAEECIQEAIRLDPNDLSLQKVLAEFYFDLHQFEKARQTLNKILEQDRTNRSVRKVLVEVLLSQNIFSESHVLLEALSQEMANDIELELLRGKYHLLTLEPVLAINHFISVLEKEPKLSLVHYLLGLAYLSSGQRYLAQQSLIQALILNPYFSEAEITLADIYYKQGDFDFSLEHARRVCDREPENFRAHLVMGNVLLAQRRFDEATIQFKLSQSIYPESALTVYQIASIAELSEQPQKALSLYRSLLSHQPRLADVALRCTRILIQRREIDEAVRFVEDVMKETEKKGYPYYMMGEIYLSAGNHSAAKTSFEQSVMFDPKLASAYIRLAEILERDGNWKEQIRILEKCVERIPQYSEVRMELARLYVQKGFWEKAVAILEDFVVRHPESPIAASNLAWLYLEGDTNLEKAFTLAQTAYEQLPQDPAVADTMGWAYYKMKIFGKAARVLGDALSQSPSNPEICFHLGMVVYAQGNPTEAIKNLRMALALGLGNPHQREAKTILQRIQP